MPRIDSLRATLREGIALPIALAAIIAVGALIAGVIFASTQEYRVSRNVIGAQAAMHGAEVGLNSVVSSWTPARTRATPVGSKGSLPDTIIDGSYVRREYTRVSPTLFWVTSTAIGGSESLQQRALKRLNALVRVDIPDMRIMGALTMRGMVDASGAATINGTDVNPAAWADCGDVGPPAAGLVVGDSATNSNSRGQCGNNDVFTCVSGSPKIADSSIYNDSLTYKNFGGFNYDSLTKLATADKVYDGSVSTTIAQRKPMYLDAPTNKVCDRGHIQNWGDTSHVDVNTGCDDYFPVIHLKGAGLSWTIAGYGGQGVLLVDGNAMFNGLFNWTGLIIVQGTVSLAGSGQNKPRITGALMAMNRNNGTNTVSGEAVVQFSRCALQAVTARLATARQTRYRAWADLSF